MPISRSLSLWLSACVLLGGAAAVQAAPPEGKGPHADTHPRQQDGRNLHKPPREERLQRQDQAGKGWVPGHHEAEGRAPNRLREANAAQRADHARIRQMIEAHRQHWGSQPALPPGIRKNLQRGKPLPPGIGKWVGGDLGRELPQYRGYEWVRAGTDLLLVSTSGVIDQVLRDAFLRR
ncbi:anti-virulence regulator CigR family protein [Pseudomonas sp. NW5]|uniref:anti-virulence regulator CigR family protein n=1 Tax=Pseudomonas sp. NW5 TaxID=2934934 RepID=UPI00201FE158|nr:anti-virulence regulator CigR family protein [Pseudomonas sp. NW5]MCL7461299.1 DUF2058 domain-containing protein [Pseudomonas sp. NW5]